MTRHHQGLIDLLSHPNAIAVVQVPNNRDQNYEVVIAGHYRISGGIEDKQLEAFDEMVEYKIVLPVNEHGYRLAHNFRDKYRKPILSLAFEELAIKSIVGFLPRLFPFHKQPSSLSIRG